MTRSPGLRRKRLQHLPTPWGRSTVATLATSTIYNNGKIDSSRSKRQRILGFRVVWHTLLIFNALGNRLHVPILIEPPVIACRCSSNTASKEQHFSWLECYFTMHPCFDSSSSVSQSPESSISASISQVYLPLSNEDAIAWRTRLITYHGTVCPNRSRY